MGPYNEYETNRKTFARDYTKERKMKLNHVVLWAVAIGCISVGSVSAHDNHDGRPHWEIPSADPDRIILTFNGPPATSRAVTWRTDKSVTQAVAQVAEATVNSKFTDQAKTVQAVTEPLDLGAYKRNAPLVVNYHSVTFTGLTPGKLYAYRVGDGNKNWSEWFQFRTARTGYAPTQFVFFGDAQNYLLAHWSRVIRMAYQKAPNASFAIHAGDLVSKAHHDNEWAQWFKAGGFIHSQWTAIPVVGNHDMRWVPIGKERNRDAENTLSMQWRPQFTLPVEKGLVSKLHESVYTVDYQDIRIIVLNSNYYLEPQTKYIEKQLKNCTAKWKIITCHHSVFSPAKGRDFKFARDHWKPLLDKYGVDLVLNGHDHTYARGHVPVRSASGKDTGSLGTVYVTSVSGPKMYKADPEQMDAYKAEGYRPDKTADQTQFFQVITIKGNKLTYVAYTAVGKEHDRATITKDFTTGKKTLGK